MKKKIVISVFSLLVLITIIASVVMAIDSYKYDMDPNNGVDILEGVEAVLILILGGFIVLYELDLFYTVYYFLLKPEAKTKIKSILNILSNLSLVLAFVFICLPDVYMWFRVWQMMTFILILVYFVLRFIYFIVSEFSSSKER